MKKIILIAILFILVMGCELQEKEDGYPSPNMYDHHPANGIIVKHAENIFISNWFFYDYTENPTPNILIESVSGYFKQFTCIN